MSSKLGPSDPFPEDLSELALTEVEILNSKVHRELDLEYVRDGTPSFETEIRKEELTDELDRRDAELDEQDAPLIRLVQG
ncbi:hypothetical protein GCM10009784_13850 [Arthrobacter parietis]|uniref:Uncharacterized protein n=2 Tax=Arthrobacter TaxID=1663 RepID=A0ABT6D092_9MICC|nr:hypothetical protein [Arthrobacter vasquezii]MDF9279639.1 hypothetical protein [Arthrobacter vasquezii]